VRSSQEFSMLFDDAQMFSHKIGMAQEGIQVDWQTF
jgi:hypothetical protein